MSPLNNSEEFTIRQMSHVRVTWETLELCEFQDNILYVSVSICHNNDKKGQELRGTCSSPNIITCSEIPKLQPQITC